MSLQYIFKKRKNIGQNKKTQGKIKKNIGQDTKNIGQNKKKTQGKIKKNIGQNKVKYNVCTRLKAEYQAWIQVFKHLKSKIQCLYKIEGRISSLD